MHICFPIKTKLKSDSDSNKDADLITLKSFFAHFVKEKIWKQKAVNDDIFTL